MELKTKVGAGEGSQDILITREFDLPVELLFRAHAEPALFEQWMSHEYGIVKVLKYEGWKFGGWQFTTSSPDGVVLFGASGVIHEFSPNQRIVRTFEMDDPAFDAQLEFLEFKDLGERSRLEMQIVFRTIEARDRMLKLPFAQGLSMAHDRLEATIGQLK